MEKKNIGLIASKIGKFLTGIILYYSEHKDEINENIIYPLLSNKHHDEDERN